MNYKALADIHTAALGAASVLAAILVGDAFLGFSPTRDILVGAFVASIGTILLTGALVARHLIKSGAINPRSGKITPERERRDLSFDDEILNEALLESETLRRNAVGVVLDEDEIEAALDESPAFAAEYLEEEARS